MNNFTLIFEILIAKLSNYFLNDHFIIMYANVHYTYAFFLDLNIVDEL